MLRWEDPFQGLWVTLLRVQAELEHGVLRIRFRTLSTSCALPGLELDTSLNSPGQWSWGSYSVAQFLYYHGDRRVHWSRPKGQMNKTRLSGAAAGRLLSLSTRQNYPCLYYVSTDLPKAPSKCCGLPSHCFSLLWERGVFFLVASADLSGPSALPHPIPKPLLFFFSHQGFY